MTQLTLARDGEALPVHPLAQLFPMLPDDEMGELAEDIRANGLLHPIMLDHAGEVLVDGRNRLRACEMAKVEPRFDKLQAGVEPADYIASVNLSRRHMTVGQRAMALAMIYPDPAKLKRAGSSVAEHQIAKSRLSYARTVLRVAPDDLAPAVLSGIKTLDAAFVEVKHRQQAAMSEEAQLARLRAEASDVADLVVEGTISLAAGLAELDQRERAKRAAVESGVAAANRIAQNLANDAVAIVTAIEAGERIALAPDQQKQIRQAVQLLQKEGVIK